MAAEAAEVSSADTWGPVCRGFHVLLPDGERITGVTAAPVTADGAGGVEAVGGIVRMAVRHSSRLASPREAA